MEQIGPNHYQHHHTSQAPNPEEQLQKCLLLIWCRPGSKYYFTWRAKRLGMETIANYRRLQKVKWPEEGTILRRNISPWHLATQNQISFIYVWHRSCFVFFLSSVNTKQKSNLFNPIWAALICGPWSDYVSNPWQFDPSMTYQMGIEQFL